MGANDCSTMSAARHKSAHAAVYSSCGGDFHDPGVLTTRRVPFLTGRITITEAQLSRIKRDKGVTS
jgi:hypothetical protein